MTQSSFQNALQRFDKVACTEMVLQALNEKTIDIVSLYAEIIVPTLNAVASDSQPQQIPIWAEHVQSAIVRGVMEIAYPYLLKESQSLDVQIDATISKPKALIFCLTEEYHEIGARMTADYLTLLGFDTIFIGANTPTKEALDAIATLNPRLVCISVTNYYHLARLQHFLDELEAQKRLKQFVTAVGGYAIDHSPDVKQLIKADFFVTSYHDLKAVKEACL